MAEKTKLPRKKKKKIKRKKIIKKNDFLENEKSSSLGIKSSQNFESLKSAFDEERKSSEKLESPKKNDKNNVSIYPNKYFLLEIVGLLSLTVVVYSYTLDHSFHFDDAANIWSNHFIQISSLSFEELLKAGVDSVNNHRPVANISFALNYYFHGLEVKGYHLVNIFIHLLAGIMLFYFVKTTLSLSLLKDRYSKSQFIPFFTALIWLVHPLHTQSVTYIVQRMNSMAALFYIMAMLFYLKARLNPERTKRILFFSVAFISGLLALGTKQNTITLPIFILLYEWYFFQDLRLKISKKQIFWIATICLVFITVLYIYLGTFTLSKIVSGYGGRPFSLVERLLTQPRVILHYISLLVVPAPSRLNLDYDFPLSSSLLSPPTTIIAILIIAGMLGLAIYTARKNRLNSFCTLWFLGNLLIESSIVPLEMLFEHRTYLPSMFAALMLLLFFERVVKNRNIIMVSMITVTLLFSYWTYERNKVWQDELTLWEDVQQKSPNKARANLNLGLAYVEKNRAVEAIPVLKKALSLYEQQENQGKYVPRTATSLCLRLLGNAFRVKGEYKKAIEYLNRALNESSNSASDVKTYHLLGQCYAQMLRAQEAVFYFSMALQLSKNFYDVPWMDKTVNEIKLFLERSKFLLEEQKKRNTIK
jgi:hypothetical protein